MKSYTCRITYDKLIFKLLSVYELLIQIPDILLENKYIIHNTMKLQQLMSLTRQALDDYKMISEGDKIAVGVSGGKDSLALLTVLKNLSRFYPEKFSVIAITVDLGFGNMDFAKVEEFCRHLDVPYYCAETQISQIVFDERKETNPCSLCSKMRKGALNDLAASLGCNKTAFGHHKDDVINTMLMSLIFEGRFTSFSPVTALEGSGLTLIRPFIYVNEADIKGFCNKYDIKVLKNACPADGKTQRQYAKELAAKLNKDKPGVKDRMFRAVLNGVEEYKRP